MSGFEQSLTTFLGEASSGSPTPGGGSVAAVAAALGASMGSMVANLTTGEKYKEVEDQMIRLAEEMKKAIDDCERILAQDIEAFNRYMAALRLPKTTEQEKSARAYALQETAKQAAEVPFRLMERGHYLITRLDGMADTANRHVLSDLGIAVLMLDAAIHSAWLTVEINLPGIKQEEASRRYREAGNRILQESAELKQTILLRIREKLALS